MSERKLYQRKALDELRKHLKPERRRELRHSMTLPVRVSGADCHTGQWNELAETANVSSGGAAIRLSQRVLIGDLLFLEIPLPPRLRKDADSSATYRTLAVVRYVQMHRNNQQIVRLQFLCKPTPAI